MQHRVLFIALCVFLILFQSRGKQLWGQGKPFTLGRMSKGSCAFSQHWTQWWFNSIYIQHSCGAAASHSNAVSDTHEAGQSSFHHYAFSSFGAYTCVVLQRLWPNSFFSSGKLSTAPSRITKSKAESHFWTRSWSPGPRLSCCVWLGKVITALKNALNTLWSKTERKVAFAHPKCSQQ